MTYISIVGTIGVDVTADGIRNGLGSSDASVELYFDSPGGDVIESNAISLAIAKYCLENPEKTYTATIGSLCASAAANILVKLPGAFSIRAYRDSLFMWHSCQGMVDGTPEQLCDYAAMMTIVNESVARALSSRTSLDATTINSAFKAGRELWIDGNKALSCGLVGELIDSSPETHEYSSTPQIARTLQLVAEYKTKRKLEAQMDEEKKEPTAEEEVVVTTEEKPAEETKEGIEKEVEKELDTPPEVDWQAECEKLRGECNELKKELDALKALVARYTPSAKPQAQPQPKTDWLALVHALNERKLTDVEYAREYGRLKAEHKAEFDAFMQAHSIR